MAAAIALRGDCRSAQLRDVAKQSQDADQVRRLLALALVCCHVAVTSASLVGYAHNLVGPNHAVLLVKTHDAQMTSFRTCVLDVVFSTYL